MTKESKSQRIGIAFILLDGKHKSVTVLTVYFGKSRSGAGALRRETRSTDFQMSSLQSLPLCSVG